MAITFSNIGLAEPSTITNRAAAVTIARGSTNEQQEILVLGDPESSLALARVLNTTPASTEWALAVREVGTDSTTVTISTGSLRVYQSTAADLLATVSPAAGSTWAVRALQSSQAELRATVYQSTAADLNVTVAGYSTQVAVSSVSGVVATAEVVPANSTYASGTKGTSGDTELVSSAAGQRICVFGYQFTIASTTPTTVRLLNGSTSEMGRWFFQAPSSVSMGANMAVSSPAYLYRTAVANNLVLNTDSTATVHYSVMAYRA